MWVGHVNPDSSEPDHGKDYGLNVIVWKAGSKPSQAATYLGIFDINAWYQVSFSHMTFSFIMFALYVITFCCRFAQNFVISFTNMHILGLKGQPFQRN